MAEPLQRQVLATVEKLMPDSAILATVLNNLATILADQERFAEAEPIYARVLDMTGRIVGQDSPEYAQALNNYARVLAGEEKIPGRGTSVVTVAGDPGKVLASRASRHHAGASQMLGVPSRGRQIRRAEALVQSNISATADGPGRQDYPGLGSL